MNTHGSIEEKLTDESLMVFGKYQGEKLANVPASYLLWMYQTFRHIRADLKEYIEENMEDLKSEAAAYERQKKRV